jgi:hypothetical protein
VASAASSITVKHLPEGGIQPQAAVDSQGTVHLLFFKGDPAAGDIFYMRQRAGDANFSRPMRVNGDAQKAFAVGTIRGAQLAVGAGRVHVAWNGLAPKDGTYMDAPMLYTRLNDAGNAFEPPRNLITSARGLDGGGSIAADERGNVFVFWHAPKPGNTNGEAGRALWLAKSHDQGKTLQPETLATTDATGACGCCGMKAFSSADGKVFAAFRGAANGTNRDEIVLEGDADAPLKPILRDPWKIGMCPMSSASFAANASTTFAAWETRDNIAFAKITRGHASAPQRLAGGTKRKHPALAVSAEGEVLVAWTEGTAWGKGGAVAWQTFDAGGKPSGNSGRGEDLPAWSFAAAIATPDGGFMVIY